MDPLVKLDEHLAPTPSLAQSWDVSANGRTVTFHLRPDGRWTNGDVKDSFELNLLSQVDLAQIEVVES